jgi:hypothetical protein
MARMLRPKMQVMRESALIPPGNQVQPAPNQFTHELVEHQPYYYGASARKQPDGDFPAGTQVVLMVRGAGHMCRVVDGRGLYVLTACKGLRSIA